MAVLSRLRLHALLPAAVLGGSLLVPVTSGAVTVTALTARDRNGQTFLTWTAPAGSGWTYRVYARSSPITVGGDLAGATLLGSGGDSSWCDQRLSSLRGVVYPYLVDSLGTPLTPTQRLFVATPLADGSRWYAVTAQPSGSSEDLTVVPGQNATTLPVVETVSRPRPVYQRIVLGDFNETCEVYALWVTDQATPLFPAMSDRASMAYDIGLVRGGTAPNNVLWTRGHGRGGSFLSSLTGSGDPLEWRVSNDDYLPNDDVCTFYYGYHEGYDPYADGNPLPTTGVVRDYTWQRVLYTLDWALATFPVDSDRVYARGGSMGGTFALDFGLHDPGRVAAVEALVPKVDMSNFVDSGLPPLLFAPMWGDPATTDLPTPEGIGVYERLRMASLTGLRHTGGVAPLVTLSGRNDTTVGWAEKVPFYAAMETNRLGGVFYWDERTHGGPGDWDPMYDLSQLRRYRRAQSFPALSRCSLDDDPGDGDPTHGDLVGQINAFVVWDTSLADYPDRWEVKLSLRDLTLSSGTRVAPASATVDVTPRRLQHFQVNPLASYAWSLRRLADNAPIASGVVAADALGLVTVPAVTVLRDGVLLRINVPGPADVHAPSAPAGSLSLTLVREPARDRAELAVVWPRAGEARIELFDAGGRRVVVPFEGMVAAGATRIAFDARTLAAGLYFARATQGADRAIARVVVLR
ncbi:MAG TPA: alpha/beta hydrolase-fold protein [Dongiaceae bacterium]|nr:alpha/beta hydrolase-fold protein [Dongiaceae bacterium]